MLGSPLYFCGRFGVYFPLYEFPVAMIVSPVSAIYEIPSKYTHMAEFSSSKTYGEIRAIDGILRRKSTAFEDKLFNDGRGGFINKADTKRAAGYYKYPYDLLTDPSHQSIMCIEIWDNNPQYLATKREAFAKFGESLLNQMRTAQTAAEADASAEQKTDIVGMVTTAAGAVLSGAGVIFDTAKQVFADGNLKGQGLGRDSYTEEQTGVAGGTSPILSRIYLYMPTGLEVGYAMEYEDASMAGLDAFKLVKAVGQGDAAAARDIGKKIGMANLKVLDSLGELVGAEAGTFAKAASAQQRQVVNPMSLHLFKEVKRREFNFSYTFLPRNREEVETCHEIIGLLKFFSHPKRSEGTGRFLDYPAEFQIKFLTADGRENGYLPYIHKCALKGVKVKYGEETTFTTFQNDGRGSAPTKITMELSFSELEILTRDRFGWELGNIPSP